MKTAPSMFGVNDEGVQQKKHQNMTVAIQRSVAWHEAKSVFSPFHFFLTSQSICSQCRARIWDEQSVACLLAHPTSYFMGTVGSFPRNKAAWERSCAGVKNECSYASATPTDFTFFLYVTQHYQVVGTNRSTFNMILLCNELSSINRKHVTLSNY